MPNSLVARPWRWLLNALPHGTRLPDDDWQARHRAIVAILWLHAGGIVGYALWHAVELPYAILDAAPVIAAAGVAGMTGLSRRSRAAVATLGAMFSSTALVHLSGG